MNFPENFRENCIKGNAEKSEMLQVKCVLPILHMAELVNAQNAANAIKINPLKEFFYISQIGVFGVCSFGISSENVVIF